ncbi:MAG: hypothetical protein KDB90_07440 [Planctomycetes bacterium]|nr:hypothetical protein [Planctomycetota bacterium]
MSYFIVTFDTEVKNEVLKALKSVPGVAINGVPLANGTVHVKTVTRSLDDESAAVHAMEDIFGVIDVRWIEK